MKIKLTEALYARAESIMSIAQDSSPFYEEKWFLALWGTILAVVAYIVKESMRLRSLAREVRMQQARDEEKKKKRSELINNLVASSEIYNCMETIKTETSTDRVLLLEVSNNGGKPKPGSKMFARAVDVKVAENREQNRRLKILHNYEEVQVDDAYIDMVLEAERTQGPYVFDVEEHKDCLLRQIYYSEGVRYSEVYHVYTDTDKWKLFIVSISTKEDEKYEDQHERAIINMCIHNIRGNFEKYR